MRVKEFIKILQDENKDDYKVIFNDGDDYLFRNITSFKFKQDKLMIIGIKIHKNGGE